MVANLQLTPPQVEIIAGGYLDSGCNAVLSMATGSGKTWIAMQAARSTVDQGRRVVYVSPLKALAHELAAELAGPSYRVGVFTSDKGRPGSFNDSQILIMTPERLDLVTRNWRRHWNWIPEVDLVVVDECQLLGDRNRGAKLEGAISRFRRLNPFSRWLALSATIGNSSQLASWLGGIGYASNWRRTPLHWSLCRFETGGEKPELLRLHVQRCIDSGGQSLVFVHSRRRAEALSSLLTEAGLRADFHHAGLAPASRLRAELGVRARETQVLVATSTLELGVNLPVRQVILYDTAHFDGDHFVPMSCNAAWQRAGRAGRPGLDDIGEVVVLAPTWDRYASQLESGRFEPIESRLDSAAAISEQILAEVDAGLATTPIQIERVLAESLAWRQGRLPGQQEAVDAMLSAGLLREAVGQAAGTVTLRSTKVGRIASRFMLSPTTVLVMKGSAALGPLTRFDFLLICCAVTEYSPKLPVDFEDLAELAANLRTVRSALLTKHLRSVNEILAVDDWQLICAIKSAIVLTEWSKRGDADAVAAAMSCYGQEVVELRDSALRLLQPLSLIIRTCGKAESGDPTQTCDDGNRDSIQLLMQMLRGGLDADAATLLLLDGIGPATARRMVDAGVGDIEDLALASPAEVQAIGASLKRATLWIEGARELAPEFSAFSLREVHGAHPVVQQPAGNRRSSDRYRLRRAAQLNVVADGEGFLISGGLEEHRVGFGADSCDCPDFDKGYRCKHLLAVALLRGEIAETESNLQPPKGSDHLAIDLERMWSQRFILRGSQ